MTDVQHHPRFNDLCALAKDRDCIVGLTVTDQLVERAQNKERRELQDLTVTDGTKELVRIRIAGRLQSAANLAITKLGWT